MQMARLSTPVTNDDAVRRFAFELAFARRKAYKAGDLESLLAGHNRMLENVHPLMKGKVPLLIGAVLALWALDFTFAQNKADAESSQIVGLENKWNAAYQRGDVAAMDSLLDDDFIITVEDGTTFSKPGYIAHNGNSTVHVEISDMSDLKVRMHGKIAVVTGAYHERGTEKGKAYEYRDRFTDVWTNNGGKWQLIVSHYSVPAHP
jgi:ketosteroid isomerase-like protein